MGYWYVGEWSAVWEPSLKQSKVLRITDLPLEGWPAESFVGWRISEDQDCHEVMIRDICWLPVAQQIWKLYPPVPSQSNLVSQKVKDLMDIKPFLWDKDLQEDLKNLESFVTERWIIDDHFQNHGERRSFYTKHPDISKYCWRISKLRRNSMTDLGSAVFMINRELGTQLKTPLDHLDQRLKSYDVLDFWQKVAFVKSLDQDVLDYLTQLHEYIITSNMSIPQ